MKKLFFVLISLFVISAILTSCGNDGEGGNIQDNNGNGLPNHSHVYGDWVTVKEPTCTEKGRAERYCDCGKTDVDILMPTDHTEETDRGLEPTCTAEGLTEGKHCSACGSILAAQSIIPRNGHTCENNACVICGESFNPYLIFKSNGDGTCRVLCSDDLTDSYVKVPASSPEGEPVVRIDNGAFESLDVIREVVISEGVKVIGFNAFNNCVNLTKIVIPEGVTTLEDCAIVYCNSLQSIALPDSLVDIGMSMFTRSEILKEITIPKNVRSIGLYTFDLCESLAAINVDAENEFFCSVDGNLYSKDMKVLYRYALGNTNTRFDIPAGVEIIEDSALYYARYLTTVTIPDGVKEIRTGAFYDCQSLQSITIPSSVISLGDDLFCGCDSMKTAVINAQITLLPKFAFIYCSTLESVSLPEGLLEIGDCAFSNCESLKSIELPDSLTKIGGSAFSNCESLKSITLPSDLNTIAYDTFYQCVSLEEITVPKSVKTIWYSAFGNCNSLKHIYYEGTEEEWNKINFMGMYGLPQNATVHYNQ